MDSRREFGSSQQRLDITLSVYLCSSSYTPFQQHLRLNAQLREDGILPQQGLDRRVPNLVDSYPKGVNTVLVQANESKIFIFGRGFK
jgi:hypothetical protein